MRLLAGAPALQLVVSGPIGLTALFVAAAIAGSVGGRKLVRHRAKVPVPRAGVALQSSKAQASRPLRTMSRNVLRRLRTIGVSRCRAAKISPTGGMSSGTGKGTHRTPPNR
jgi:hypothetical protein